MTLFAIFGLGPMEIAVIVVLGVLLFGRKLPDVGRYLGKSITEFRKGYKGLEEDMDMNAPAAARNEGAAGSGAAEPMRVPQKVAATAPKFDDAAPARATSTTQPQV